MLDHMLNIFRLILIFLCHLESPVEVVPPLNTFQLEFIFMAFNKFYFEMVYIFTFTVFSLQISCSFIFFSIRTSMLFVSIQICPRKMQI